MKSIVSVIEDGIIRHLFEFDKFEDAESAFVDLVTYQEDERPNDCDLSDSIMDGYWQTDWNGIVICIGQSEVGETSTILKEIRENLKESLDI